MQDKPVKPPVPGRAEKKSPNQSRSRSGRTRRNVRYLARSANFMLVAAGKSVAQPLQSGPGDAQPPGVQLFMAVPKRLLKRAVDRNIVRRAGRESWRVRPAARGKTNVLLRLTGVPPGIWQLSRGQRRRFWRAEIDALMDQYLGQSSHAATSR